MLPNNKLFVVWMLMVYVEFLMDEFEILKSL